MIAYLSSRKPIFAVLSILAGMLIANLIILPGSNLPAEAATLEPTKDADSFEERAALFTYDTAADFDVKEVKVEKRDNVSIHDISFVGIPGKEPIKAYLVVPDGAGPFAAILWVHWLGEEKSDRSQYLDEAVALASKGTISLLVNAMWSQTNWYGKRVPEEDYQNSINQVIEIERAMDLLLSQPNIDKDRVGFVGHDYGGMYGMLAAGVNPRAKTYVFIAVAPTLNDWAFFARQPESKAAYLRQNAVLELTDYLHQVNNASILFQFAKEDVYVSDAQGTVIFRAANNPKERKVYDDEHSMKKPEVAVDRDAWLVKELGLAE